jgi:DNA-binding SARP family transcriptional activator
VERFLLSLLGPFELKGEGGQIVDGFVSDKARALLAYLAVEAGQPHRRDTLAGLLWSEMSDYRARRNLSEALYNLRQLTAPLSDELFDVTAKTIRLLPGSRPGVDLRLEVDVRRLENALLGMKNHPHVHGILCPGCRNELAEAVALYRGEFLAGMAISDSIAFEEWLLFTRQTVQREIIESLYLLARDNQRRGESEQAVTYLRRILSVDSLREGAHRQLIALLAISGQRNEALRQYERCRDILWQELRVEPDSATQTLHEYLLSEAGPPDTRLLGRDEGRVWVEAVPAAPDSWGLAQTLETAAQVARDRGDYGAAKENLENALAIYEEEQDQHGAARALTLLGLTERDRGEYQKGEILIRQARERYLALGDHFSQNQAKVALARLLSVSGAFAETISLLKEALPLYRELHMQRQLAYQTVGLAMNEMLVARYDEARSHAQRGIQLAYAIQDRLTISFGTSILGMTAVGQGDYTAGEQMLKQALVLARVIGRPEELSGTLAGLGYIMLQKGDVERARQHIRDGLQQALKSHSFPAAILVLPAAAHLLKVQDKDELAMTVYLSSAGFEFFRQSPHFIQLYTPFFGNLHVKAHRSIRVREDVADLWRCLQEVIIAVSY